ncbi:hypothetical protein SAMN05216298_2783 [Glycomyces sambucus]|uniref:Uncharacterized protein n=1 Tax=Glycomyces sambucus TaxID=380244 RepID=A0A1G9HRL6_9ACTN|nr:hypothetical protein [Glycomyces sambucus]SDL15475.1 hypothetical protein SAMN05216298_2783 [Glycomyces sambucus]
MVVLFVFVCMLVGSYFVYWAVRQGVRDALEDDEKRRLKKARPGRSIETE